MGTDWAAVNRFARKSGVVFSWINGAMSAVSGLVLLGIGVWLLVRLRRPTPETANRRAQKYAPWALIPLGLLCCASAVLLVWLTPRSKWLQRVQGYGGFLDAVTPSWGFY